MSSFSIPILLLIAIGIKGFQNLIRNHPNKSKSILALLSIFLMLIVIAIGVFLMITPQIFLSFSLRNRLTVLTASPNAVG